MPLRYRLERISRDAPEIPPSLSLGAASQFDSVPTDTDRCHPEPVELLGLAPKARDGIERDLVGPPLRMTRAEKACIIPHFTKFTPVFRRGGDFCAFFSSFLTYFVSLNR